MNICSCGGRLQARLLRRYEEKNLGLGVAITICDAVTEEKCALCGKVENITISNLEGLIAAVAVTRVKIPLKLGGREIRFLRKAMELTAKELGAKLKVTDGTVSRWENDVDPIGSQSEQNLRLLVGDELKDRAPLVVFSHDSIRDMQIVSKGVLPSLVFTLEREKAETEVIEVGFKARERLRAQA